MPKLTRYQLQNEMAADIQTAIDKVETAHDLALDPDAQRRLFRSVVTIAAQRLFDRGVNPQVIAASAFEAVANEFQRRSKAGTPTPTNPFGTVTPAQA